MIIYKENEANFPRLSTDKLFVDYNNSYTFKGYVKEAFDFVNNKQLLRVDLWKRFVQQFREDADYEAGWRGEYWGKMMRGACWVYSCTKDSELYDVLTQTVKDILDSADEYGRISSYAISHEFDGWDLWSRKYVLLGLQYYIEICTDKALIDQIIQSMCKQVDYLITKIGPNEGQLNITNCTRHWRGLNSSSILEPIVRLYTLTKKQEYFDFATYIVELGGTDIVSVFDLAYEDKLYPYQYPVTKAYEMTSCFEGLLEYYRITKNEYYKTAIINYANKILESDFTIIGCSGCTHELFDHSTVRQACKPIDAKMQETCVTVTLMKFFFQLFLLTDETKYIDAIETSFFNAYLGSFNTEDVIEPMLYQSEEEIEIEPLPFDSYSPLTAGTRGNGIGGFKIMSDKHYYGCCACIASLGIGLACKAMLLRNENGFKYSLYLPIDTTSKTPNDQNITFSTKTDFPKTGNYVININLEKDEEFEINFRIPHWAENTIISVNNEVYQQKDNIITIKRIWCNGDVIEINFDIQTKIHRPISYGHQILMNEVIWGHNYIIPTYDEEDPIAKNHLAITYGPIVLAQDNRLGYNVDEPSDIKLSNNTLDLDIDDNIEVPYTCLLKANITLNDGSKMKLTDYSSAGKLWTEESKMAAWILTK